MKHTFYKVLHECYGKTVSINSDLLFGGPSLTDFKHLIQFPIKKAASHIFEFISFI